MSIRHVLVSVACISAGLVFGYGTMNLVQQQNSENQLERSIASVPILKIGADQIARDYLTVKMNSNETAGLQSETSILKVTIKANKDIPAGFQYKWHITDDMTTTDALTGLLPAMQAGEEKEISLNVIGFSKEIKSHISFSVAGVADSHQLRREVIASSRPEDSFEYVVRQAALYEQESGKVQKLSSGKARSQKFDPKKVVK